MAGPAASGPWRSRSGRLFGLHVIVTCGTDEKCAAALELGAEAAVNYRTGDFVEAALSLTDGKGVAVVLDMVGGDYVPRNLAALADGGPPRFDRPSERREGRDHASRS